MTRLKNILIITVLVVIGIYGCSKSEHKSLEMYKKINTPENLLDSYGKFLYTYKWYTNNGAVKYSDIIAFSKFGDEYGSKSKSSYNLGCFYIAKDTEGEYITIFAPAYSYNIDYFTTFEVMDFIMDESKKSYIRYEDEDEIIIACDSVVNNSNLAYYSSIIDYNDIKPSNVFTAIAAFDKKTNIIKYTQLYISTDYGEELVFSSEVKIGSKDIKCRIYDEYIEKDLKRLNIVWNKDFSSTFLVPKNERFFCALEEEYCLSKTEDAKECVDAERMSISEDTTYYYVKISE